MTDEEVLPSVEFGGVDLEDPEGQQTGESLVK